jgi:hypothetical protein
VKFRFHRQGLFLILLCIVTFSMFLLLLDPINSDAAQFLLLSKQLLTTGLQYGNTVWEPNPPIICFLSIPPVWLSLKTHLSPIFLFYTYVFVLIGISLLLCNSYLRNYFGKRDPKKAALLILICVGESLAIQQFYFLFGEREHIFVILILPYLISFLSQTSPKAKRPPMFIRIATGVFAGLGMGMKPHFVLTLLIVELLSWKKHHKKFVEKVELLSAIAMLGVYFLILLIHGSYLKFASLIAGYYLTRTIDRYGILVDQLTSFKFTALKALILLFATAILFRKKHPIDGFSKALMIFSCSMFVMAMIEGKGWEYHFLPSLVSSIIFIGYIFVKKWKRPTLAMTYCFLLFAIPAVRAKELYHLVKKNPSLSFDYVPEISLRNIVNFVEKYSKKDDGIAVFSFSNYPLSQISIYTGRENVLPSYDQWVLASAYDHDFLHQPFNSDFSNDAFDMISNSEHPRRFRSPENMSAFERKYFDSVVAAILKKAPKLILNVRYRADFVAYFTQNPEVKAIWKNYDFLGTLDYDGLYIDLYRNSPFKIEMPRTLIELEVTSPSDSLETYAYLWNGHRTQRYLLDTNSKAGTKYSLKWLLEGRKAKLLSKFIKQTDSLEQLAPYPYVATSVSFSSPDTNYLDIHEFRFEVETQGEKMKLLSEPLAWHNSDFPAGPWVSSSSSKTMKIIEDPNRKF